MAVSGEDVEKIVEALHELEEEVCASASIRAYVYIQRETDRQKDRQTDRQADRKTDRQTDRKTDRQTD